MPKLIVKGKMLGKQLVMVLYGGMIGALAQQGNGDACMWEVANCMELYGVPTGGPGLPPPPPPLPFGDPLADMALFPSSSEFCIRTWVQQNVHAGEKLTSHDYYVLGAEMATISLNYVNLGLGYRARVRSKA